MPSEHVAKKQVVPTMLLLTIPAAIGSNGELVPTNVPSRVVIFVVAVGLLNVTLTLNKSMLPVSPANASVRHSDQVPLRSAPANVANASTGTYAPPTIAGQASSKSIALLGAESEKVNDKSSNAHPNAPAGTPGLSNNVSSVPSGAITVAAKSPTQV